MSHTRLSWDQLFMRIAGALGARTSCVYHQIGCVFVDDLHRIITVGYNGSPRGDVNCDEVGCAKTENHPPGRCRGIHDVINALLNCVQPDRLRGSTLYTSTFPCHACMKALVQAGIKAIVYRDEYLRVVDGAARESEPEARALAERMGIALYQYDPERSARVAR